MNEAATELAGRRCSERPQPLSQEDIERLLAQLDDGWSLDGAAIGKTFRFRDYGRTMAFVNAIAWIAQREDHHPDLHVGYDSCRVAYRTHMVDGLSENDFICAAKVDDLLRR